MCENKGVRYHIDSLEMLHGLLDKAISGEIPRGGLTFQIPQCSSHIVWLLGHLAWSLDGVVKPNLGMEPTLPSQYGELFAFGVQPGEDASRYPDSAELVRAFNTSLSDITGVLAGMGDDDLEKPLPDSSPARQMFPSVSALLRGIVFHTGYHIGQVCMLRRAQGLPTGFGM